MVEFRYACDSHLHELAIRMGLSPHVIERVGKRITPLPSRKCFVPMCRLQATWIYPKKFTVEIRVCGKCRGQNLPGDKVCSECGAPLEEPTPAHLGHVDAGTGNVQEAIDIAMNVLEREKTCSYCGAKSIGKFECPRCGAPLK